ncbi:MAG: hypothetical protein KAI96_03270 [Thermodesulfovibrionia bacterium]|nr:hypothetical protein [Thermodesulfovibrionia bacterium]MCK5511800.1 hypothetical protein [Thermodesulfovibrionia bacterium]
MPERTQLEIDLEREQGKKPKTVYMLIIFLSVSIALLGAYTIKLRYQLSKKEHDVLLIERNYNEQKSELLNRIEELKKEYETRGSRSGSVSTKSKTRE